VHRQRIQVCKLTTLGADNPRLSTLNELAQLRQTLKQNEVLKSQLQQAVASSSSHRSSLEHVLAYVVETLLRSVGEATQAKERADRERLRRED